MPITKDAIEGWRVAVRPGTSPETIQHGLRSIRGRVRLDEDGRTIIADLHDDGMVLLLTMDGTMYPRRSREQAA